MPYLVKAKANQPLGLVQVGGIKFSKSEQIHFDELPDEVLASPLLEISEQVNEIPGLSEEEKTAQKAAEKEARKAAREAERVARKAAREAK